MADFLEKTLTNLEYFAGTIIVASLAMKEKIWALQDKCISIKVVVVMVAMWTIKTSCYKLNTILVNSF